MSNNQQIVMNRIKVVLAEKQPLLRSRKQIDGWQSKWGNQRILYQDGALINHNHL